MTKGLFAICNHHTVSPRKSVHALKSENHMFSGCFMFEYKCMHLFSKTKCTPLNRNLCRQIRFLNDTQMGDSSSQKVGNWGGVTSSDSVAGQVSFSFDENVFITMITSRVLLDRVLLTIAVPMQVYMQCVEHVEWWLAVSDSEDLFASGNSTLFEQ